MLFLVFAEQGRVTKRAPRLLEVTEKARGLGLAGGEHGDLDVAQKILDGRRLGREFVMIARIRRAEAQAWPGRDEARGCAATRGWPSLPPSRPPRRPRASVTHVGHYARPLIGMLLRKRRTPSGDRRFRAQETLSLEANEVCKELLNWDV